MMRTHHAAWAALCATLAAGPAAAEDGLDERVLEPTASMAQAWKQVRLTLDGYLRVRGELWNDLDLSRGPTPTTGLPIFPTPAAGGDEHTLTALDMRLRLEPTLEIGQAVRLHMRVDVLDNVGYGSTPDVLPSSTALSFAASSASSPEGGWNALRDAVRIKQAWGEVTLPFGVLSAGRMGALVNWGTGFFVNSGSCLSCDHGDAGDRIALTIPLLGHYLTGLYELSSSGPYVDLGGQSVDVERRAHASTWALAFARFDSPEAQLRRLRAGRTLVQYGLLASYRSQDLDAPAWVQPGGLDRGYSPVDFVHRGLQAFSADLWLLVHRGGFRAELEVATVIGKIEDATNQAGVSLRQAVTSAQYGGVASASYTFRFPLRLRCEVGMASGDDAPGFGVRWPSGQLTTQKGDLDGPQLRPPTDTTIDNFRFHPDYRVDLILWRRIVGRVSDAVYVKPSVRLGPFGTAMGGFTFEAAVVESRALHVASTPGQAGQLGVEVDLLARYRLEPGFEVSLAYGVLVPGDGFRNRELGLAPQPAQALELILAYRM